MDAEELLDPEWKKLVLPVILTSIMVFSIFGLYNIRMSGIDQTAVEETRHRMVDMVNGHIQEEAYNNTVEPPEADDPVGEWMSDPVNIVSAGSLFVVYQTPLFLLEPGDPLLVSGSSATIFTGEDGYFLSTEIPAGQIKIMYQEQRIEELNGKAANQSINSTEYRERMNRLKDLELNESMARQVSEMDSEVTGAAGIAMVKDAPDLADIYLEKGFHEIQFHHFVPGLIVTFVFWYLVSAVLVESFRRIRELV
jgi:uncharacterized coiled-coil protein SlyX